MKITFLLILMLISMVSSAMADGGVLKNNGGTINNTGIIRLANQAMGLPMVNSGAFEFVGADQPIPPRQFEDLRLLGTGTKTLSGGNVSVFDTMIVASGVTVVTDPGRQINLNGTLDEQGYILGTVEKTVNLSGGTTLSTYGNMGATISWSGNAPGTTTVTRVTGQASTSTEIGFTGNQSILRYFDVAPTFGTGLNGTFVFRYHDSELNGNDENTLSLWRSPDGGSTWRKQAGTVDATQNTITKTGILNFSRWTASDASRPLGPNFVEGVAQNIALTSGSSQSGATGSVLPLPFITTVRDFYGNPISGVSVSFAITSAPGGATGQNLSATSVLTNANGQASSILTLGSLAGTYSVTASSGTLVGSPVSFTATATGGGGGGGGPVASSMVITSGNSQVDTVGQTVEGQFVVTVLNQNNLPFPGDTVNFVLTSTPVGDTSAALSARSVVTGANGQAATLLTLGRKVGTYTVTATSRSLPATTILFTTNAVAGKPAYLVQTTGNNQSGQIRSILPQPLAVAVTDTFGNAKQGVAVRFSIAGTPVGAVGQGLSDTLTLTNASGLAQTTLTLGDSAGIYSVAASSGGLNGSPSVFLANAIMAAPKAIAETAGNNQRGPVATALANPFVVTVTDSLNNPVPGVTVSFAITQVPQSAAGQSLSISQVNTDAQGRAFSTLTLGSRPGAYQVQASAPSLAGSPVTFNATAEIGAAALLAFVSGDGQQGEVSTTLPQPLRVQVLDGSGNPVQNIGVLFSVDSIPSGATGAFVNGSGSTTIQTDGSGIASIAMTLGNRAGVYRVSASSSGLAGSPIYFRLMASTAGGAVAIFYTEGNQQRAPILTELVQPLVVTILSASGTPVANVPVTFAIDSIPAGATGQDVLQKSVTTDVNGRATTILRLGSKVGVYKVTATSSGLSGSPIEFRASATYGAAAAIAYVRGDGQTRVINSALDSTFLVRITDVGGNAVPGAGVQFALDSIPLGAVGQSLSVISSVTNELGEASTRLTFGSKVGRYVVTAASASLAGSPVRFVATALHGPAAAILLAAGSGQQELITSELVSPFVVLATDAGGNAVPGVSVQFAISGKPEGAVGEALRVGNNVTDSDGTALAFLKLGNLVGMYSVQATSANLVGSPILFTATATRLISEAQQNVKEMTIADLTTMIDHINQKVAPLTGPDSTRADVNRDRRISVADVIAVRETLLTIKGDLGSLVGGATSLAVKSMPVGMSSRLDSTADVKGEFVLSENGLRFHMTNKLPVKGLQLIVRLRNAVSITAPDVVFDRAQHHQFYINTKGLEMRIVAYNLDNIAIAPDSGAVFRLPLKLTDVEEITDGQVIVSKADNVIDADQALKGDVEKRTVDPEVDAIPYTFVLHQNYPNPFNAQTRIEYEVADVEGRMARILIQVYSLSGEKVKTLFAGERPSGRYSAVWDGTDDRGNKMASGTYFYRLISGSYQTAKRMILLK
ncbi:MAG: T9SS type A sorting domain-containing protein [Ignavibacteriales bacterium]|nr:T9SS type A sorting domain-containing protein [Ignavibacteriales bacterium]